MVVRWTLTVMTAVHAPNCTAAAVCLTTHVTHYARWRHVLTKFVITIVVINIAVIKCTCTLQVTSAQPNGP